MNAASKLAAMAKVLETPVAKKNLQRNLDIQGTICSLLYTVFILLFNIIVNSGGSQNAFK